MKLKQALNKEDWKQKRYYASKTYSVTTDEIPVKGVESFTYTGSKGDTIIVYYELKIK